jgi:hypothetical protein
MSCLSTHRLRRVELQKLDGCSIIENKRDPYSCRRLGRPDQNFSAFESLVQIVDGKSNVRNGHDNRGYTAMRLEADPFDAVRTRVKTRDVNTKVHHVMLSPPRLGVWNPDVVVPPSELRCDGRELVVQSLSHHSRLFIVGRRRSRQR